MKRTKEGDRVLVSGWTGKSVPGTVTGEVWSYHHRLYQHCWHSYVRFDEGHRSPLSLMPIPNGYLRPLEESEEMHTADELFHKLWTKAVGTEDYDKGQWKKLQGFIDKWVAKARKEQAEAAHDFEKHH